MSGANVSAAGSTADINRSEILFQHYCNQRGYKWSRPETVAKPRIRLPDYLVDVGQTKAAVEVKEIVANREETRLWRESRSGKIVVHGREPGKRARSQIEAAIGQLRSYSSLLTWGQSRMAVS
jgi:hypothetical protein